MRQDNPVIFLADSLIHKVLEARVVTVAEEGADFKAQLTAFLNGTGNKLGGVIVRSEVADHRNTHRPFVVGDGRRNGDICSDGRQCSQQAQSQQRCRDFFIIILPCLKRLRLTALYVGNGQRNRQHQAFNDVHRVIRHGQHHQTIL